MKAKATAKKEVEKLLPLGDRVYKQHREMLTAIAKLKGISNAKALRSIIEESYARLKR